MKTFVLPAYTLFVSLFSLSLVLSPIGGAPALSQTTLRKELVRAPFFQGSSLPTPPQQHKSWPHKDDDLSQAVAVLFEQGCADPRGLEYREVEIATGTPWNGGGYLQKTHGWVLPGNGKDPRFAIAWNGLMYPALRVGEVADLHKDWEIDTQTQRSPELGNVNSELASVSYISVQPLKLALLLRLGEGKIARRLLETSRFRTETDAYVTLASAWAWYAFERAVCAHERGDDHLALADARLLTRIQPLIQAEVAQRVSKERAKYSTLHVSASTSPVLSFLRQLPALLADCERRVARTPVPPSSVSSVTALVDDLENVDARQYSQPGGLCLDDDPRVQSVVEKGVDAIAPLLDALEQDHRLTRSVTFHRDFDRDRYVFSVADIAQEALANLAGVDFTASGTKETPWSRKEVAAKYREYFVQNRERVANRVFLRNAARH